MVVDFYGDKEENNKSNIIYLYFQVRLIYNPIDYPEIFMTLDLNKENSNKSVYNLFIEQEDVYHDLSPPAFNIANLLKAEIKNRIVILTTHTHTNPYHQTKFARFVN